VLLKDGERLTTRQVAGITGLKRQSAHRLMDRLCRVDGLPLTLADGRWQLLRRVTEDVTDCE
jgi:DNA-binding IclR family transcriptional regulator